ncbi:transcriptional regulator with XRE-family HTH domain [Bacillus pakistanensis]|uniref:Transcriptional regulator with XRE-family HTH domain n=1 Tax=Rossellomorea pakistanensis TaxID=992288 RepID=A0ABS2NKR4_9BACI|nr:helix-turn-helix domain-containing protein [Bacillus pakistanensis]MBM7588383.1 transcriptional regulator with XRE-family HTH domain [Bacillus pakistanensis]
MNYSEIGKNIKELRKTIGLTQGDLADGICTQALISRIEKGDIYPSATVLYEISQKLGVDINYFFEIGTTPRLDYVKEVERQLKIARRKLKYEDMMEIVRIEEKNSLFKLNKKNLQLLYWHKGIYQYENDNDMNSSLKTLNQAMLLTANNSKAWSEREIEIFLTIGAIQFNENHLNNALDIYSKIRFYLKKNPYLQDITIMTRLFYNISRVYTRLENYNESILYCKKGISWCIKNENMSLLAQLHYQIGYNYERQSNFKDSLIHLKQAQLIFKLQSDDKYKKFIENKIEVLEKK